MNAHRLFVVTALAMLVASSPGCKGSSSDAPAGSGSAPVAASVAPQAPKGLGVTLDTFKQRWNAKLGEMDKQGTLKHLALGEVQPVPGSGEFAVSFPGSQLTGTVNDKNKMVQQIVLRQLPSTTTDIQQVMALAATKRLLFTLIVASAAPGVDEMGVIKDLGMVTGTSTSTVRGNVKLTFSEPKGGTETLTAAPAAE